MKLPSNVAMRRYSSCVVLSNFECAFRGQCTTARVSDEIVAQWGEREWLGCRLVQVRAEQIAAVMEGDLAGEGGRAAAAVVEAADAARSWSAGKGGAFYAQGEMPSSQTHHLHSFSSPEPWQKYCRIMRSRRPPQQGL